MADKSASSPSSPPAAKTPSAGSPAAKSPSAGSPSAGSPQSVATAAAPANTGVLEADDFIDDGDVDSAYGASGDMSDTTSVASFIFKYRQQNGRTYHAYQTDGEYKAYFLPNDERENERLDLQHSLLMLTQDNKLFTCPHVEERPLKRVLDVGCGTGIWSIDFADDHPDTQVVGIDLSPIQPGFVPPNVEFFVDDVEVDWNFVHKFNFIYARFMTGSLKDWPRFFRQAFTHLQPGGYVEVCDILSPLHCDDGTLKDDSPSLRWSKLLLEASQKIGAPLDSAREYKQQMTDAGFRDVVQVEYKWPTNGWPRDQKHKEIGIFSNINLTAALQALTLMLFTQVLGWSQVEVEVLLAGVRSDTNNKDIHAYWPIWVVYGQKPE